MKALALTLQSTTNRLHQYFQLTKPRVNSLIVFCAVIGMFLATPAMVPWRILLFATLGIALVAGAAAAMNCLIEQKIDAAAGSDILDVEQVFAQFKKGVEEQVDEADSDTHFDLGIAYKEMGLLDDAISEFQVAMRNPVRECQRGRHSPHMTLAEDELQGHRKFHLWKQLGSGRFVRGQDQDSCECQAHRLSWFESAN